MRAACSTVAALLQPLILSSTHCYSAKRRTKTQHFDNGGRGSGTTMTERRLRVRTRSLLTGRRDPKSSLFARLSPRTARDLLDAAVADDDDDAPGNGWSVASCGSLVIEFLPLKVFFDSGDIIYTSYNGGSIADEGTRLHIYLVASFSGQR